MGVFVFIFCVRQLRRGCENICLAFFSWRFLALFFFWREKVLKTFSYAHTQFLNCAKPTRRTLLIFPSTLSYFSFLRYIAAKFFLTNSFFAFFFFANFCYFSSSSLQFFSYFLVVWYSSYTLHASLYEIISTKTASISFMHIWVRVRL